MLNPYEAYITAAVNLKTDRGNCSYDDHDMAEVEIGKIVFF